MAGESLISAHMEETPFETFTTSFVVNPPAPSAQGVYALPGNQVEDARSSAIATVVEAEFEGGSEKPVRISSEELFDRCRVAPHLHWVRMDGEIVSETPEIGGVALDDDGNAFVIAIGDRSCAPGASLIEADLEAKPFTTLTGEFVVEPPQPTGQPEFTIEKLQTIAGSGAPFTKAQLTGAIGRRWTMKSPSGTPGTWPRRSTPSRTPTATRGRSRAGPAAGGCPLARRRHGRVRTSSPSRARTPTKPPSPGTRWAARRSRRPPTKWSSKCRANPRWRSKSCRR